MDRLLFGNIRQRIVHVGKLGNFKQIMQKPARPTDAPAPIIAIFNGIRWCPD